MSEGSVPDKKSGIKGKRIVVTGSGGFLGSHVTARLRNEWGAKHVFSVDLPEYDLRNIADVQRMYRDLKPEIVIHLAARVGSIAANKENPALFFYDNAVMDLHLMHEGHLHKLEKFVTLGTVCAYPKDTPVPFREEDLWNGYPEETSACYGLAKKMTLVQAQAYRRQYGMNAIYLLPVNLYGPGENLNPRSPNVIPSLIMKCLNAMDKGEDRITVWGSGRASREFLYVEDAAEAIILATERYDKPGPVNIGSGFEIRIEDLARLIVKLTGFKGEIRWDRTKPDGQLRLSLDVSKAEKEFGFKAKTHFEEGLQRTIDYYRSVRNAKG